MLTHRKAYFNNVIIIHMYVRMHTAVNVYIYIHVRLVNERSIGIYELIIASE